MGNINWNDPNVWKKTIIKGSKRWYNTVLYILSFLFGGVLILGFLIEMCTTIIQGCDCFLQGIGFNSAFLKPLQKLIAFIILLFGGGIFTLVNRLVVPKKRRYRESALNIIEDLYETGEISIEMKRQLNDIAGWILGPLESTKNKMNARGKLGEASSKMAEVFQNQPSQ